MSDIRAGDVVVCVDDTPTPYQRRFGHACLPITVGAVYRVLRLHPAYPESPYRLDHFPGVDLGGVPKGSPFSSVRFRKLNDEPEQIEIVERIKRCVPSRPLETISSSPKLRTVGEGG